MKNTQKVLIMILFIFLVPIVIHSFNYMSSTETVRNNNLRTSEEMAVEYYYDVPWLSNYDFSSGSTSWYSSEVGGDPNDVSESISNGIARFSILGGSHTFSEVSGTPQSANWIKVHNPYYVSYPDYSEINSGGCFVSHLWTGEGSDQNPSVQWKRNVSITDDMSNYKISSVSLNVIVNVKVTTDGNTQGELGIEGSGDAGVDDVAAYATGDYARFTVYISDLDNKTVYKIAWLQTYENLGDDGTSGVMNNVELDKATQDQLIRYLTSVLSTDNHNFTITLEIRIHCEDNIYVDNDQFESLYISTVDLTFTYEKIIYSQTKASWNQVGPTFSDKKYNETNNITLIAASLSFDYSISKLWPTLDSPNAQIIVSINDNQNPITTYLETAETGWKTEEFDVFSLISVAVDYVNFSIQLYLGDTFGLDQDLIIYLDNINLKISYQEIGVIPPQPPGIDWTLAIILLTMGIIASIVGLVSYIYYFQFPPLVRKIRSLRRKIKRGRSLKNPVNVTRRESLVKNTIRKQLDILKIEPEIDKAILPIKK